MYLEIELYAVPHLEGLINVSNISSWQERGSMDSIHQAKLKSGHLLLKIALVQSQRALLYCGQKLSV